MKRVVSGIVFVPLFVALLFFGSPGAFFIFTLVTILIAIWEYFNIISRIGIEGYPYLGLVLSFLLTLCFYLDARFLLEWVFVSLLGTFSVWAWRDGDIRTALDQIVYTIFGVLWVGGTLGYLVLLRNLEDGDLLLSFLFLTVWSGDTAAYYGGKTYGRRSLAPAVSPKKTFEGAIFGLVGSVTMGLLAHFWFIPSILIAHCLIMGLFCGIIGQLGDLAESVLKRHAGVSDSGNLIPGHGGVLDRMDGIMFAGPALYFYYKWVVVG